jgi:hypothetical protein
MKEADRATLWVIDQRILQNLVEDQEIRIATLSLLAVCNRPSELLAPAFFHENHIGSGTR